VSGKRRVLTTLYQSHHEQEDCENKINILGKISTLIEVYSITNKQTTQKTQKMVINQTITEHRETLTHQ